jgi:peptidoglycan/xylan/chitin deacetylase (PgdA/CDA1 family)
MPRRTVAVFVLVSIVLMPMTLNPQVAANSGTPILAYHRFHPLKTGYTTVTTATLESQLHWLTEHHYTVVPLKSVVDTVDRTAHPRPDTIAITVDDGHIPVLTILFPIIVIYHIPVTLFIYPSAISNASYALTWDELKEMKSSGLVDIQAHTYWHPNFRKEKARLGSADYNRLVMSKLVRPKAVLEQRLGSPITLMAWPYGIYDQDLEQAAAKAGYSASFAYAGGAALPGNDAFAIPRIPAANYVHGEAFAALLNEARTHPNGSSSGHK